MNETISTLLTAAGLLFSGAWALLQIHFKLKEKLSKQEEKLSDNVNYAQNKTIERLEKLIEKLDDRQESHEKTVAQAITVLSREMGDLRVELKSAAVEWNSNRIAFSQIIDRLTEVIQVGPNSVLVRDKKK